jgi:hypothetical protein
MGHIKITIIRSECGYSILPPSFVILFVIKLIKNIWMNPTIKYNDIRLIILQIYKINLNYTRIIISLLQTNLNST